VSASLAKNLGRDESWMWLVISYLENRCKSRDLLICKLQAVIDVVTQEKELPHFVPELLPMSGKATL